MWLILWERIRVSKAMRKRWGYTEEKMGRDRGERNINLRKAWGKYLNKKECVLFINSKTVYTAGAQSIKKW